jgi:hypothetical protein
MSQTLCGVTKLAPSSVDHSTPDAGTYFRLSVSHVAGALTIVALDAVCVLALLAIALALVLTTFAVAPVVTEMFAVKVAPAASDVFFAVTTWLAESKPSAQPLPDVGIDETNERDESRLTVTETSLAATDPVFVTVSV